MFKYRLERWGSTVVFQVTKPNKDRDFQFISSNNFRIEAVTSPELTSDSVYLCGKASGSDNVVITFNLSNKEEAEEYIIEVDKALQEYQEHLQNNPEFTMYLDELKQCITNKTFLKTAAGMKAVIEGYQAFDGSYVIISLEDGESYSIRINKLLSTLNDHYKIIGYWGD